MTIKNGWVEWAIQAPGIPDKIYTQKNAGIGLVGHSIVGTYQQALGRFMSEQKDASGNYTPYAAASVMFILCKNGDLIQMYDIWSSTWTSGGRIANCSYWAIEAEGGPASNPSESFTAAQRMTLLELFHEFEEYTGRRVIRGSTFREHGELAAQLGYAPTACPSHRYDWFTQTGGDDMSQEDIELLHNMARRVFSGKEDGPISDEEHLANARFRATQWSEKQAINDWVVGADKRLDDLENSGGAALPHHHTSGPPIPDA